MRRIVNGCVGCDLPCIGAACPHEREVEYYCDKCGVEDTLYDFYGEELCVECILKRLDLTVVDGTEW